MEISTGPLTKEQFSAELPFIVDLMKAYAKSASYMYGWACNIPIDRQWQMHPVAIEAIAAKVEESLEAGIFSWGEADLYLYDGEERFHFLLCHEGDVHFTSADDGLVALVRAAWEARGYTVYAGKPRR
jgi:hypothetical protein